MRLAHAHSGTETSAGEPAGGLDLILDWTFDPTFLVPLVIALLYFRGLWRYWALGGVSFPAWRPAMFLLGLATLAAALLSPIDALADRSFAWHMVQHLLLTLVAAPLILLGAPFVPVIRGLPAVFRRAVFIPFARNRAVRWILVTVTRPIVAFIAYTASLWAWHDATLYDLTLANELVHYLEHFNFFVVAVLLWWHVVSPHPFRSRMGYLARIGFLIGSSVQSNALGALIAFSGSAWYAYRSLPGFWGLTAAEDQMIGGLLMWVGGAILHLIAITIIFVVYAIQEQAKEPPRMLYIHRDDLPGTV